MSIYKSTWHFGIAQFAVTWGLVLYWILSLWLMHWFGMEPRRKPLIIPGLPLIIIFTVLLPLSKKGKALRLKDPKVAVYKEGSPLMLFKSFLIDSIFVGALGIGLAVGTICVSIPKKFIPRRFESYGEHIGGSIYMRFHYFLDNLVDFLAVGFTFGALLWALGFAFSRKNYILLALLWFLLIAIVRSLPA
jgi:hypothetical protein